MRQQEAAAAKAAAALKPMAALFSSQTALVFTTGPSLTQLWSPERPLPFPAIAVNDAWRIVPGAQILYGSDAEWWEYHKLLPEFRGLKVGCYECRKLRGLINLEMSGDTQQGYDPRLGFIRTGVNSGYAAVHLAAQLSARRILLVGFDMRGQNEHFFGPHPKQLGRKTGGSDYPKWIRFFEGLGKELAARGVEVLNATPGSAMTCFPMVRLEDVCPAPST